MMKQVLFCESYGNIFFILCIINKRHGTQPILTFRITSVICADTAVSTISISVPKGSSTVSMSLVLTGCKGSTGYRYQSKVNLNTYVYR